MYSSRFKFKWTGNNLSYSPVLEVRIIYNTNDVSKKSSYNVYLAWFIYNKDHLKSYCYDAHKALFNTKACTGQDV